MVDKVWQLRRHRGKGVEYRGKPYMLLGAHYKKIGTENVFGTVSDVLKPYAELLLMGTSVLKYVPAEEVKLTNLKWDFEERRWYSPTEQMVIGV